MGHSKKKTPTWTPNTLSSPWAHPRPFFCKSEKHFHFCKNEFLLALQKNTMYIYAAKNNGCPHWTKQRVYCHFFGALEEHPLHWKKLFFHWTLFKNWKKSLFHWKKTPLEVEFGKIPFSLEKPAALSTTSNLAPGNLWTQFSEPILFPKLQRMKKKRNNEKNEKHESGVTPNALSQKSNFQKGKLVIFTIGTFRRCFSFLCLRKNEKMKNDKINKYEK